MQHTPNSLSDSTSRSRSASAMAASWCARMDAASSLDATIAEAWPCTMAVAAAPAARAAAGGGRVGFRGGRDSAVVGSDVTSLATLRCGSLRSARVARVAGFVCAAMTLVPATGETDAESLHPSELLPSWLASSARVESPLESPTCAWAAPSPCGSCWFVVPSCLALYSYARRT